MRLTKFIEEKEPKVLEVRGSNNKNEIYNNYNNKKIKKKNWTQGSPGSFGSHLDSFLFLYNKDVTFKGFFRRHKHKAKSHNPYALVFLFYISLFSIFSSIFNMEYVITNI